jgi:hypothetical protein
MYPKEGSTNSVESPRPSIAAHILLPVWGAMTRDQVEPSQGGWEIFWSEPGNRFSVCVCMCVRNYVCKKLLPTISF